MYFLQLGLLLTTKFTGSERKNKTTATPLELCDDGWVVGWLIACSTHLLDALLVSMQLWL
jgi:hypothetical protein